MTQLRVEGGVERTLYKKPESLGFRPRVFPMTLASHLLNLNLFFGNDLSARLLISNTQGGFEQDSIHKMLALKCAQPMLISFYSVS